MKFNISNISPSEYVRLNDITDGFILKLLETLEQQEKELKECYERIEELEALEEEAGEILDSIRSAISGRGVA